jgi:hypothetical protein
MTKGQFILYAILITLLAVLGMAYDSPRSMTIQEVFGWLTK